MHEVRWCFHTTAMVTDYERTRDALARLVGCRPLEDLRDESPEIGRRGGMTWIGDNSIELGESIVPDGAVDKFVRRFGSHMSSIAVQVRDIDATVSFLESAGVRVASRIDDVIVFTDPRTTAGIVIEWYGGEAENDPRFGAPMPPPVADPVLDVRRMSFGGAVVTDPAAAAARLAELFATEVTFVDLDARPGTPQAGVSMGDMTLALYPVESPADSTRLWAHVYERPQTSNLGIQVVDLEIARTALAAAGVGLVRDEPDHLVVHPDETGGVILVVSDRLLPNDPRAD